MVSRFFSLLTAPVSAYFELTVGAPCRAASCRAVSDYGTSAERPKAKSSYPDEYRESICHASNQARRFSFFQHLRRQRAAVSPEVHHIPLEGEGIREHYVRDTYLLPSASRWIH
ncbi:MAG: hypothetical protein KDD69_10670 [Bdellovibrionales bacterium]|nr:hypothetical protein [Bdellovibrionales bacterium]